LWLLLSCCVQLILTAAGDREVRADDLELMEVLEGFDGLQNMHHPEAGYLRHPLWQVLSGSEYSSAEGCSQLALAALNFLDNSGIWEHLRKLQQGTGDRCWAQLPLNASLLRRACPPVCFWCPALVHGKR
jgi:hypothetical protein